MKLKQKLCVWLLVFSAVAICPLRAFASSDDDTVDKVYDARLENYDKNVTLDSSSTALLWILLIILAALCVGVMFKNAKRTHLD